jgi:3-hydroxyacyl-CoA dehydrogenase
VFRLNSPTRFDSFRKTNSIRISTLGRDMSAEYKVDGSIAVITLNNPPVNGLGHATRHAIVEGMKQAQNNDAVKAIIITGAGKAFSGGADIKEFNSPKAFAEPSLHTVISVIESSDKPVIAAIQRRHGRRFGIGFGLPLSCRQPWRTDCVAKVKLGILPGAGGTQRLPRVVGLELALNMIVSGTPIASEKLAKTALFNELAEGDLMAAATAFAHKVADVRPLPKVRDIKIDYPNYEAFLQFSRNTVRAMSGPFPAPLKCVEALPLR